MTHARLVGVPLLLAMLVVVGCSGAASRTRGDSDSGPKHADKAPTTTLPGTPPMRPREQPSARTIAGSLQTVDGRTRTYRLYVPSSVTPQSAPVPLLIALHGGGGSGEQFEQVTGYDGLAESNRFIVAYPDGTTSDQAGTAAPPLRTWNAGACCGIAQRMDVDDVGYVRLLIAHLAEQHPIDPKRVFVTGHSNGGMLAYRLACQLADVVAAVGVQSATLEFSGCRPSRPVSLLHIHGSADENVPINGGTGTNSVSRVSFNPPLQGVETIAAADGCGPQPGRQPDLDNADVQIQAWQGCADHSQVTFVTVDGAAHPWMGQSDARSASGAYPGLDSSAVIWAWLAARA